MTQIEGTLFIIDGTWYLRYLHGGGVMVPVSAAAEVAESFRSGRMATLEATLEIDHRGCLRKVDARACALLE